MKVIGKASNEDLATVYLAQTEDGNLIEFVESIQPPFSRDEKWVLIISTLVGCVVNCPMCDAGGRYSRKLSYDEMLAQIDHMVIQRFPDRIIPVKKFKIQFARMGEPSLNPDVLKVLENLPKVYNAPGLLPSLSTVAPINCDNFFTKLLDIKNKIYPDGKFQLQFSLHSSDEKLRDKMIPIKKWKFEEISKYGELFRARKDKKISLNFALAKGSIVDADALRGYFDPKVFLIKITPINPTLSARENKIESYLTSDASEDYLGIITRLRRVGFDVIVSIGEVEENKIGSNCGQYIKKFLDSKLTINGMYEYKLEV